MALDPPLTPPKGTLAKAPEEPASAEPTFLKVEAPPRRRSRRPERLAIPPTVVQPLDESGRGLQGWLSRPLPVIGRRPLGSQIRILGVTMVLFVAAGAAMMYLTATTSTGAGERTARAYDLQAQSHRLARAAPTAVQGSNDGFKELSDSREQIERDLAALAEGDAASGTPAAGSDIQTPLAQLQERWKTTQGAVAVLTAQRKNLATFSELVARINESTAHMQELAEGVLNSIVQRNGSNREVAAAGQLLALTQAIGRSANSMISGSSSSSDAAAALGHDIALFRDLTVGLFAGSDSMRLTAVSDAETRGRLAELVKIHRDLLAPSADALANARSIGLARDAARTIATSTESLRAAASDLISAAGGGQLSRVMVGAMGAFWLAALLCSLAMAKVMLGDSRRRAGESEQRMMELQRLEEQSKRRNERNQAAILRLMNELQEVADGNLTVQATVTEDITGAIADSVNYTVEELRGLVGRINGMAEQVNTASTQARDIATRLLAASESQSREIRGTGEKVLQMAQQINDVSTGAGESAKVARASLEAAERGQRAAYNQIAGMNEIREHIQETAKRIKRLGESSQEIGEIVELITDITEQTNVLALNAAIQAASAGEAGRGFTVVAEEVQRLADRSAEAAKQIGALVRTIQTDTQDAVTAMERSTQGVVEGTKLSDAAGTALAEIGRVSRQLAELIERIAQTTSEQASSAGGVAVSMERILTVTEQTSHGTRQTAQSIGQLATLARELKASVARFRVAAG
ncbi:MAG: type IV pili methyl-accepting chemotaxis transducer N-terminal domain-containing protein [Burkholderiaceae bacterium]|nr:type IV pili methyl-accepting chemotaxis transducer N-terminal domain-containing protein [Burkholderiaceae bacterium]